jgi:hypothetical protein
MTLSTEALASIVFGILQLAVGTIAPWQQHQFRRLHSEFEVAHLCYPDLLADFRFEGRRYTI